MGVEHDIVSIDCFCVIICSTGNNVKPWKNLFCLKNGKNNKISGKHGKFSKSWISVHLMKSSYP